MKEKNEAIKCAWEFKIRCKFTVCTTRRRIEDRDFSSINSWAPISMDTNSHVHALARIMDCLFC
jgi:hypothetical protein